MRNKAFFHYANNPAQQMLLNMPQREANAIAQAQRKAQGCRCLKCKKPIGIDVIYVVRDMAAARATGNDGYCLCPVCAQRFNKGEDSNG